MELENPLITIIIPIYNREQTLERCLCSVLRQTYSHLEIIAVDDGSTDHSRVILDKYQKKDSRLRVVRKENSGVSESRNLGLQLARGEYIQFVDADDWITRDATEILLKAMQTGSEMVITDYYRVIGRKIWIKGHIPASSLMSRAEFARYMMKSPANFYYGVTWNKFYRMDIIRDNALFFSRELDWCEDFKFNLEYLKYVSNIRVETRPIYYYVKTNGSLVDSKIDLRETIRTKRILFGYYKELYQALDMYEENKLKIQSFYLEFARDKIKSPVLPEPPLILKGEKIPKKKASPPRPHSGKKTKSDTP